MDKNKKIGLTIFALSILTSCLIFIFKNNNGGEVKEVTNYSKKEISKDRKIVSGVPASEMERFAAVMRLGLIKDESILPQIISSYNSETDKVKEAIIQTLGRYESSDADDFLIKVITSTDKERRYVALKAIGLTNSTLRLEKLNQYLKESNKFNNRELIYLYSSLHKIEQDPTKKEKHLIILSKHVFSLTGPLYDEGLTELLKFKINSENYIKPLKESVLNGKGTLGLTIALRKLSINHRDWVLEVFEKLIKHDSEAVRAATLQSIQFICPTKLWAILGKVITTEKSPMIIDILLRQLTLLNRDNSLQFLKSNKEVIIKLNLKRSYDTVFKTIEKSSQTTKSCNI